LVVATGILLGVSEYAGNEVMKKKPIMMGKNMRDLVFTLSLLLMN
jgi:hypothetical protein